MLIGKYILVVFHSIFVIGISKLKAYMTRECLITPVLNLNSVPSPRGAVVGLVLQKKIQANPN